MKTMRFLATMMLVALTAIPAARADVDVPTPERIRLVAQAGSASALWATLEHGQRVLCMSCIPLVERRLYDSDSTAREIAAWWLRQRPIGFGVVFGKTVRVLFTDADPVRRSHAAEAIGEFLDPAGRGPLETALTTDPDARVRAAAARGLSRLNHPAAGSSLAAAFADADAEVRLVALDSAVRLMGFADGAAVARLVGDPDARVRRRAISALGDLRLFTAAPAVVGALLADPDARVRQMAVIALMQLRASEYLSEVDSARLDPSPEVRDAARIAYRGLTGR